MRERPARPEAPTKVAARATIQRAAAEPTKMAALETTKGVVAEPPRDNAARAGSARNGMEPSRPQRRDARPRGESPVGSDEPRAAAGAVGEPAAHPAAAGGGASPAAALAAPVEEMVPPEAAAEHRKTKQAVTTRAPPSLSISSGASSRVAIVPAGRTTRPAKTFDALLTASDAATPTPLVVLATTTGALE
jgi:hypothetical protein